MEYDPTLEKHMGVGIKVNQIPEQTDDKIT